MNPRVGVGVFVFNKKGEVVLGRRKNSHGAGTWAFPGGHLEFGESFEECAAREVLEETGLKVSGAHFLTTTNDVMVDDGKHYITVFVGCHVSGNNQEPQLLEPEKCDRWEWVTWDEIRSYLSPIHGDGPKAHRKLFLPLVNLVKQRPGFDPTCVLTSEKEGGIS
ncbi:hypothetical protein N7478_006900 [Penicillium angulare]|uniref:uncharacterized protein n=1 Tax=Penicillium angulare TaxID=116970 RepID=UPI002540EFFD|nr:uncharacterized protein N7478_006900 [Penicillium angulare]KAJ5281528.1 hypothetical protein N7478_006900 [Penicillium angulare]